MIKGVSSILVWILVVSSAIESTVLDIWRFKASGRSSPSSLGYVSSSLIYQIVSFVVFRFLPGSSGSR